MNLLEKAKDCLAHLERMVIAGADNTADEWFQAWGEPTTLLRTFRDGTVTREVLPRLLAEWTLATIPEREPGVARAKLSRIG
jgi:hypothetical protein